MTKNGIELAKPETLEPGDVVFTYNHGNWLSRAIWYVSGDTRKRVSHVALYLGYGVIAEMMWEGLRVRGVVKYDNPKYEVHARRAKSALDVDRLRALALKAEGDVPYAYLTLLWIAVRKLFRVHRKGDVQKDAMMCSEWIVDSFRAVGYDPYPGCDAADVTPGMLWESKTLEEVF